MNAPTRITFSYGGHVATLATDDPDTIHETLKTWLVDQPPTVLDDIGDLVDTLIHDTPDQTEGECQGVRYTCSTSSGWGAE